MSLSLLGILEKDHVTKSFHEGTQRSCAPSETIERVRGIFPLIGLTRVANITGLDVLGVPVYTACRPNARSLSTAQGKGYTHEAARASAVMESIETYHAETIQAPLQLCSYNEIRFRDSCVDPFAMPHLAGSDLTANHRLLWIEGVNLLNQGVSWAPFEAVHTDYTTPVLPGHGHFVSSSNGLSSGNTFHEALIHGICEIIERDAVTLFQLRSQYEKDAARISLETIDNRRCAHILHRFLACGIHIGLWDITSDIGIPAFLCRILPDKESDIAGIRPVSGMGCHMSKDIAMLRALTEAAQSRLSFISGGRDDLSRRNYQKYLNADEYAKWLQSITSQEAPPKSYKDIPDRLQETFAGDLQYLLNALKRMGIESVTAVDLTKEEIGIPVTRIVIPGLESFRSGNNIMPGPRARRLLARGGVHG